MNDDAGRSAPTIRLTTMHYRPSIGLQECYEHFEDCFVRYLNLIAPPPYLAWMPASEIPDGATIESEVYRRCWRSDGVEVVARSAAGYLLWLPKRVPFSCGGLDSAYFLAGFAKNAVIPDSIQGDPLSCICDDSQLIALPGERYAEIQIWCRPARAVQVRGLQGGKPPGAGG